MKRFIVIGLVSVLILYLIPLLMVFVFQRRVMYFPPAAYLTPQSVDLAAAEEVFLQSPDGYRMTGWWLEPPDDDTPVVMFFHGNGSAVYSNYDIYADLHARGYGVYGTGYIGYPGSGGSPSQAKIVEGARVQYDWLIGQGIAPGRIVFYGTSLGTGIASQLALERRPARMILEAPFNSTLDMGRMAMPVFPVGLLMKDTYRSDLAAAHFDMPISWLHGTLDEVVPLSQGQKLYEAYTGPKNHLVVEGGRHTNLWALGGREFVLGQLEAQASGASPIR